MQSENFPIFFTRVTLKLRKTRSFSFFKELFQYFRFSKELGVWYMTGTKFFNSSGDWRRGKAPIQKIFSVNLRTVQISWQISLHLHWVTLLPQDHWLDLCSALKHQNNSVTIIYKAMTSQHLTNQMLWWSCSNRFWCKSDCLQSLKASFGSFTEKRGSSSIEAKLHSSTANHLWHQSSHWPEAQSR